MFIMCRYLICYGNRLQQIKWDQTLIVGRLKVNNCVYQHSIFKIFANSMNKTHYSENVLLQGQQLTVYGCRTTGNCLQVILQSGNCHLEG